MGYANTKYKTEKRKANVGERILITNANTSMGYYDNGDVLTVASHYNGLSNGIKVKETKGDCPFIRHEEYEVIVEVKPSYPERISLLESQVAELQAKVEALEKVKYVFGVDLAKPTPNEQRKAAIKRAKAFIEEAKVDLSISRGKGYVLGEIGRICDVQFIVNNDKRTVVALFRWRHDGNVYAKAIAKCAPDDVFNADIGKAIALGRALGLDVSEFENAVKPTEVVVGMVVYDDDKSAGSAGKVIVVEVRPPGYCNANDGYTYADGWAWLKKAVIIDDTDAKY